MRSRTAFVGVETLIHFNAGGIGSATGRLLHSEGAKIALLFAPFEFKDVKPTISSNYGYDEDNGDVKAYQCDITSPESVNQAFSNIQRDNAAFPSILVNAAGYVNLHALETFPADDILKHYMINLYGPTLTSKQFLGRTCQAATPLLLSWRLFLDCK